MARKRNKRKGTLAERADLFDLYQRSVQSPDHEVDFFDRVFREEYDRKPLTLREDFCGTAAVCCEWAKSNKKRTAVGIDIDPEPMAWCREHNMDDLSKRQRERVELVEGDVRAYDGPPADVLAAQNFSFYCFRTRDELREYFRVALAGLADEGVFVCDMMGGAETLDEDHEEVTDHGDYDYVWKLDRFDPVSHSCRYSILFRFEDDSEITAFRYDWRHWTIPEVRELLAEAGFSRSVVFWEGTDPETEEGSGDYEPVEEAESDPAWVCYLVAYR